MLHRSAARLTLMHSLYISSVSVRNMLSWLYHVEFRLPSPQSIFLFGLTLLYIIITQHLRTLNTSDPSSLFFNATRAHERRYSAIRINEANEYMAETPQERQNWHASTNASFCVGIVTVRRNDTDYFRTLVGSLLRDLSRDERHDLPFMPFIANTDPYAHTATNATCFIENWTLYSPTTMFLWRTGHDCIRSNHLRVTEKRHCTTIPSCWRAVSRRARRILSCWKMTSLLLMTGMDAQKQRLKI